MRLVIAVQPANLGSMTVAKHVDRDPEQPRTGVRKSAVVAASLTERRQEDVGYHVVDRRPGRAPPEEAVERVRVPLEDHGEDLGISQRALDQPCVGRLEFTWSAHR